MLTTSIICYENGTLDRLTDTETGLAALTEGDTLTIPRAAQMRGHGKATVLLTHKVTASEARRLQDEWDKGEPIRLSDAW